VPQVFINGRYIGGWEELLALGEESGLERSYTPRR
jgi:glutaredoxin-related protein